MARRASSTSAASAITRAYQRGVKALTSATLRNGRRIAGQVQRAAAEQLKPPRGPGDWLAGAALGPGGARRYHLYRPPDVQPGERLPLLVMLHGCAQTGRDFASSTRMNLLAEEHGCLVAYPAQPASANISAEMSPVWGPDG